MTKATGHTKRLAGAAVLVALLLGGLAACSARQDPGSVAAPIGKAKNTPTAPTVEATTTTAEPEVPVVTTAPKAPVVRLRAPQVKRAVVTADQVDRSAGYEVRVDMRSADQVPTGSLVTTTVSVSGAPYPVIGVDLDYGDGSTGHRPVPGGGVRFSSCDSRGTAGSHGAEYDFGHGYRRSGTYDVRVLRVILECGEEIPFAGDPLRLTVVPGPATSNGPELPTSTNCVLNPASFCAFPEGRTVRPFAGLSDPDGYVESAVIDWGDGSAPSEVHFPLAECQDPGGNRYPNNSRQLSVPEHTYAGTGTYTVTLTVVSTGCDGKNVQRATFDEDVSITQ